MESIPSVPATIARRIERRTILLLPGLRRLWRTLQRAARAVWVPPRLHAFEFCDQAWLTGCWREAYLDGLNFLFRTGGVYGRLHQPFARWAKAAGEEQVLDLASGGGGPMETVVASAQRTGTPIPFVTLSDLYPDLAAFDRIRKAHPKKVGFNASPLDATRAGSLNAPLISICTGFHHFTPGQARRVLGNAVQSTHGIFLAEVFPRNVLTPLLSLPNLPLLLLAPFFSRRFSWKKLAIGTLLPVVPLMIVFDGTVSALRVYRPEELLELLPEEARRTWHWESGSKPYLLLFRAHYWFGYRIRKDRTP